MLTKRKKKTDWFRRIETNYDISDERRYQRVCDLKRSHTNVDKGAKMTRRIAKTSTNTGSIVFRRHYKRAYIPGALDLLGMHFGQKNKNKYYFSFSF